MAEDIKHKDYVTDYEFKRESSTRHFESDIKRYENDIKRNFGGYGKNYVTTDNKNITENNNFGFDQIDFNQIDFDEITGDADDIYISKGNKIREGNINSSEHSGILKMYSDDSSSFGQSGSDNHEGLYLANDVGNTDSDGAYTQASFSSALYSDNRSDIKYGVEKVKTGSDMIRTGGDIKKASDKVANGTKNMTNNIKEASEAAGEYSNPYGYIKKGIRYAKKVGDKTEESFSNMERGNGYDFTRNRRTTGRPSFSDFANTDTIKKILIILSPILLIIVVMLMIIAAIISFTENESSVIDTGDPRRYIARHLHNEGYNTYAIAAILGATQIESGVDPTEIEGDYIAELEFPGRDVIVSDKQKRYSYTVRYLNYYGIISCIDNYKSSRGADDLWMGTGMCQWTADRGENVVHYIGNGEFDYDNVTEGWDTVRHQMEYFDYEMDFENEYPGAVTNYYNSICDYLGDDFKTAEPIAGESDDTFLDRLTRAYKIVHLAYSTYDAYREVRAAQDYFPKIEDYLSGSDLIWPIPGCYNITSPFGPRIPPTPNASAYHMGIDIGAIIGTSVTASADGVVVKVVPDADAGGARGKYLIVDHGKNSEGVKISTLYQHLSSIEVEVGDDVMQGEVIAKSGNTGVGSGPHLHFEVHEDGEPVNPLKYVSPE